MPSNSGSPGKGSYGTKGSNGPVGVIICRHYSIFSPVCVHRRRYFVRAASGDMNQQMFFDFLKDGETAKPPAPPSALEAHDHRFHPKGYKPGAKCKYREALERGDDADKLKSVEQEEWEDYKKRFRWFVEHSYTWDLAKQLEIAYAKNLTWQAQCIEDAIKRRKEDYYNSQGEDF